MFTSKIVSNDGFRTLEIINDNKLDRKYFI